MKDYDVIIIGAGVSGCAIARELAKGKLRIAVLEAKSDVSAGTDPWCYALKKMPCPVWKNCIGEAWRTG